MDFSASQKLQSIRKQKVSNKIKVEKKVNIVGETLTLVKHLVKKPPTDKKENSAANPFTIHSFASAFTIRAHLTGDDYAVFYNKYHHGNVDGDYFYKILAYKYNKHKDFLSIDDDTPYKIPFTREGFHFKNKSTRYFNEEGMACMPEDCLDKDVQITLIANPYDYRKKKTKYSGVGLCIKAMEIKALPKTDLNL